MRQPFADAPAPAPTPRADGPAVDLHFAGQLGDPRQHVVGGHRGRRHGAAEVPTSAEPAGHLVALDVTRAEVVEQTNAPIAVVAAAGLALYSGSFSTNPISSSKSSPVE